VPVGLMYFIILYQQINISTFTKGIL